MPHDFPENENDDPIDPDSEPGRERDRIPIATKEPGPWNPFVGKSVSGWTSLIAVALTLLLAGCGLMALTGLFLMGLFLAADGLAFALAALAYSLDPPQQDYQKTVRLRQCRPLPHFVQMAPDTELFREARHLTESLLEHEVLAEGIVEAVERYQGAQACDDKYWARIHKMHAIGLANEANRSLCNCAGTLERISRLIARENTDPISFPESLWGWLSQLVPQHTFTFAERLLIRSIDVNPNHLFKRAYSPADLLRVAVDCLSNPDDIPIDIDDLPRCPRLEE